MPEHPHEQATDRPVGVTLGPRVTDAAVQHLAGRPLVLRASPRHGCCGGHALLPVAEVGPPAEEAAYTSLVTPAGVECFIDPRLSSNAASWTVDAVGLARWRRLHIDGATGVDPATEPSD